MIEPLEKNWNVKISCHLYDAREIEKSRSGECGELPKEDPCTLAPAYYALEKSNDIELLKCLNLIKDHGDAFKDNFKSIKNFLQSHQSTKRAFELIEKDAALEDIFVFCKARSAMP